MDSRANLIQNMLDQESLSDEEQLKIELPSSGKARPQSQKKKENRPPTANR